MLSVGRLVVFLALAGSVLAGPVQNPYIFLPPSARAHRDAVQQIFTESYSAYKLVHSSSSLFLLIRLQHFREFAFGHDDLSPLSQGMVLAYSHRLRLNDLRKGFRMDVMAGVMKIHPRFQLKAHVMNRSHNYRCDEHNGALPCFDSLLLLNSCQHIMGLDVSTHP